MKDNVHLTGTSHTNLMLSHHYKRSGQHPGLEKLVVEEDAVLLGVSN